MNRLLTLAGIGGLAWWRSRSRNTGVAPPPGGRRSGETRLLQAGAMLLQSRSPVAAMNVYLNGFHFAADDLGQQMEAHHYCAQVTEDFMQCVIFDGNRRDARLIGVEYIISERLFEGLPDDEKRLWHSHHYEVKSGTLVAAGIPERVERELMKKVIRTYGKTWHTWDTNEHALPIGIPRLMMAFTGDGQVHEDMVAARDERFGVSTEQRRRLRAGIPEPGVAAGANPWERGKTLQLALEERPFGRPSARRTGSADRPTQRAGSGHGQRPAQAARTTSRSSTRGPAERAGTPGAGPTPPERAGDGDVAPSTAWTPPKPEGGETPERKESLD